MRTLNERLQSELVDALRRNQRVDVSAVGVPVADGVATLGGDVPSWEMRCAAVDVISRIPRCVRWLTGFCGSVPGTLRHPDTNSRTRWLAC